MEIEGLPVSCGLVYTSPPEFDRDAPEHHLQVLVKKRAFSCNYRDKNFILKAAVHLPASCFYTVGSDFVGEVVDCGAGVTGLQVGDRVIGNNSYPHDGRSQLPPGVPTNQGSKEYQSFHQEKLLKIPPELSDIAAAAFSIGAQTAYSMVRKLEIKPGANVLITAAKSNTSLFIINALKQYDINLYATSTSLRFEPELHNLGVKQLIQVNPESNQWVTNPSLKVVMREIGGFDHIIDPFFDLHIGKVIPLFKTVRGGKYITCGFYDQYSKFTGNAFYYHGLSLNQLLTSMMLNNIHIIGNCLGTTADLQQAIQDHVAGKFSVVIDSHFTGDTVKEFLARTYNASDRFGKVVYSYD